MRRPNRTDEEILDALRNWPRMPDATMASKLGCRKGRVLKLRQSLYMLPYYEWLRLELRKDPDYGKATPYAFARKVGVSAVLIRSMYSEDGITAPAPRPKRVNWRYELLRQVGWA